MLKYWSKPQHHVWTLPEPSLPQINKRVEYKSIKEFNSFFNLKNFYLQNESYQTSEGREKGIDKIADST